MVLHLRLRVTSTNTVGEFNNLLSFNHIELALISFSSHRSRAHIQRCNGEADPTTALIASQNDEDGCSLESGDIDEADSTQLETVRSLLRSPKKIS